MQRKSYRIRTVPWEEAAPLLKALREAVFVSELGASPRLVEDAIDPAADTVHVVAAEEVERAVGAGRVHRDLDIAWISRMAVLGEWRAQGVGHAILSLLLAAASRWDVGRVHLHAPIEARRFYARHGFVEVGPEFLHGGLPHVEMRLDQKNA